MENRLKIWSTVHRIHLIHLSLEVLPDEGMRGDEVVGGRRPLRGVQPAALGHEGVEGRRQRPRAVRLHQRHRRLRLLLC